jgi:poly-gamma-glutamate capsule biosynthesis protein CapA/YwtB (metallophosphatase superfamily)
MCSPPTHNTLGHTSIPAAQQQNAGTGQRAGNLSLFAPPVDTYSGEVRDGVVTVFLCGDVMTGRGVDQILPHPGDPRLWETYVRDARTYVELAESVNGPIRRPVDFSWPWGDALETLDDIAPDVRAVNLETSITRSDDVAVGKAVHYRMNPANLPCLALARPNACALANNHVLDFGYRGLEDTLDALRTARLPAVGAGRDASQAERPAVVTLEGGGRVVIFSFGTESSGVPQTWAATRDRPGIDFLVDQSDITADDVTDRVSQVKRPGDVVIASIHWGSNWGYEASPGHVGFAHRLIDGGVDVVHGHSSHHPRPIEVYRGKLVLYGCGDFIDDYEGITGYEEYRDDLRLMYFASVESDTGNLVRLRMAPMQARQMRLRHASSEDAECLRSVLDRVSRQFGSRIDLEPDGMLSLRTACAAR